MSTTETLGRLYLWQLALKRIIELLEFRKKVDRFYKSGRPSHITKEYDKERARLKTGLHLKGEELDNFEEKNGSLFPDIHDIHIIDELITEEIIIKFCTIFNNGNGKTGIASANKRIFWEPILDEIISSTFRESVKDDFYKLIEQAKKYRDKRGAHFDEESFKITHGNKKPHEDGLIYSIGWSSALLEFDWNFVAETIPLLNQSLNKHIQKLQSEKDQREQDNSIQQQQDPIQDKPQL